MSAKHESAWAMATEAALAYADAPAEDPQAYARARDRARKAWLRYGVACLLGKDREVRVYVRYVSPRPTAPGQLALWPARTSP